METGDVTILRLTVTSPLHTHYVVWFDVGGRDDQLEKRNQQAVLRESVAPKE
jgi:hypothetical protein